VRPVVCAVSQFNEPDFENPALMLVTYVCSVCGLRDRAQIERKAD
jgi:hypothetical protein